MAETFNKVFLISIVFILSLFPVFNLIENPGTGNLILLILVFIFDACILLLAYLIIKKIIFLNNNSKLQFLFFLFFAFLIYLIIVSSILKYFYGSFLSANGILFFINTRTFFGKIIFCIGSVIVIFLIDFILLYLTKRRLINQKEIGKIGKKLETRIPKEIKQNKILGKRVNILYLIIPLTLIFFVLIFLPEGKAQETNPFLYFLENLFKNPPKIKTPENILSQEEDKILNFSVNKKLNVIIIMLESIPAEKIHSYGYERNITPNIDKLGSEGFFFNKTYASASHSDYSQTSFLSARYILTGEYRNSFKEDYPKTFIWDVLKKHGYNTAYISSQDDNWANMIEYYNLSSLDLYSDSLSDGIYDYGSGNAKKDYDENTTEKTIDWIENTSEPFFLYVNLQATHYPYSYPKNNSLFFPDETKSILSKYFNIAEEDYNASVNKYDNALYYTDKQVGEILEFLRNKKLIEKSIIIVTSDHGEILERRHGYIRHGFGVYEEEVRVPFIMLIPNKKPKIINEKVRQIDIIPSILSILNFSSSENFQGKPFSKNPDIFLMAQNQNFKIGLVKKDIKYLFDLNSYVIEVYNLTEDALEQNNLVKNKDDEEYYSNNYGYLLFQWFRCQSDYYANERWLDGENINCTDSEYLSSFSNLKPFLNP